MLSPKTGLPSKHERLLTRRGLFGGMVLTAGALGWVSTRASLAHEGPHEFTAAEQVQLDTIVTEFLAASGTPGAIVGIWFPERGAWVKTYGIGNLDAGVLPQIGDRFRIGDITQTFVATLLLQLVDTGQLSLETPLSDFAFDLPESETATLADLLGMTSGIFDYTEDAGFLADYRANPAMSFAPEDALVIARAHEPYFSPGTGFRVSATNSILAGMIAEQLMGAPLEQLIAERLLTPQLLSATSFPTDTAMPDPYLSGYAPRAGDTSMENATASNPGIFWAAGAMISNLNDVSIWAELLLDGSLLSPQTQSARMHMIPVAAGSPIRYGLGIMELFGFYGHAGGIAGYSTIMLRDPEAGSTIVVATNLSDRQGGGADTIALRALQLLLPERFGSETPEVLSPGATPVPS